MAYATRHNGGRTQVNLNGLQSAGDFAFLNCMKTAQAWGTISNAGPPDPSTLDSDGYPTSITNGGVYTKFFVPTQAKRLGNYVARWSGNGTVYTSLFNNTIVPTVTLTGSVASNVLTAGSPSGGSIQKGMTLSTGGMVGDQLTGSAGLAGTYSIVSGTNAGSQTITLSGGSKVSSTGSGRYVFSTTDSTFLVGISAITGPRITNLEVFHVDDEALLDAGEVFGVKFKQKLMEANFGVIRFMQWQNNNQCNMVGWTSRKPLTYAYYAGSEFRASLYAGTATLASAAYTIAAPSGWILTTGGKPADKTQIHLKFGTVVTSACTLKVTGGTGGDTGDINILSEYSAALSSGGNSYPIINTLATLTYDATLDAWIKRGGDVADFDMGIDNGIPPELWFRLCAEIGAHPHVCPPAFTCDPDTGYITSMASHHKTNYFDNSAAPWMVPRYEGPNELWNTAPQYYITPYAIAKATSTAYNWGVNANYNNWYGKVLSIMGQALANVYSLGNLGRTYHVLCGVQSGAADTTGQVDASDPRMTSAAFVLDSTVQSPYVKSAAKNWVSAVAVASYLTPSYYNSATESGFAAEYAAGSAARKAEIANAYADSINWGTRPGNLASYDMWWPNWKTWAQKHGISVMTQYEGAWEALYLDGGSSDNDILRKAGARASRMRDYTIALHQKFLSLGDNTFRTEFPSDYLLSGTLEESGSQTWPILVDIYETNVPRWDAICAFNSLLRAVSPRLKIHG